MTLHSAWNDFYARQLRILDGDLRYLDIVEQQRRTAVAQIREQAKARMRRVSVAREVHRELEYRKCELDNALRYGESRPVDPVPDLFPELFPELKVPPRPSILITDYRAQHDHHARNWQWRRIHYKDAHHTFDVGRQHCLDQQAWLIGAKQRKKDEEHRKWLRRMEVHEAEAAHCWDHSQEDLAEAFYPQEEAGRAVWAIDPGRRGSDKSRVVPQLWRRQLAHREYSQYRGRHP